MNNKLICFDLDGVIFKGNNFWMHVHDAFGTLEEGEKLTEEHLDYNYDQLVYEVVEKLWNGRDATPYFDLVMSLEYIPGVGDVMNYCRNNGYAIAIVSASSMDAARRVQSDFQGIDYLYANELVIEDNKVTGAFVPTIGKGNERKADAIKELSDKLNIPLSEVIYVGDTKYDKEAFEVAGRAIAFNPKDEDIKKVANHVVESNTLADIIPYIP